MKTLALVGRTNVGKSTIFNRFAGFKSAIVSNQEALTRDKKAVVIKKGNKAFNLIELEGFFHRRKVILMSWFFLKPKRPYKMQI